MGHNSKNWKRFVSAQVDAKTFGCRVKKLAEIPKMKTKLETTFRLTSLLLLFLSSVYAKTAAEEDRDLIILLEAVALAVLAVALIILIVSCCCFWKMLRKSGRDY
ncbi:uncharacterized protein LOC111336289 [Stylophora pistillata]|nr:uncharacterized protein LOC111336289 [Stylophora pistillata]